MIDGGPSSVRDAVHLVLEIQLGVDTIGTDDRLFEDLDADSFDLMNVVVILEEDHGVAISETAAASVHTVGDLVSLLESLKLP
jgi:acyl carrier protein